MAYAFAGLVAILVLAVAAAWGIVRWQEGQSPRLIVLMYHRFVTADEYARCKGTERIYSLPVERFEEQLRRLRDGGYTAVTLADAVAFARGERSLPQPAVLISIDDGCRSVLTRAEPLLRKYGLKGVLFVTTDPRAYIFDPALPEQVRLSDDELRGIDPAVIEIASHGVTHRPLTSLNDAELRSELADSRHELERVVGRPVRSLAAPGGWYDDRVREAARQAGYDGVCVSDVGSVRPGHDPLRLPRVNVAGYADLSSFDDALCPSGVARRRFKKALRQLPQQVVGARRWELFARMIRGENATEMQ